MFVVEDGTGIAGANSFASVAEFDEYCAAHLYADTAAAETEPRKQQALQMASRIIDATVLWKGVRKVNGQGLGWPRLYAPEFEFPFYSYSAHTALAFGYGYRYYDSASVPKGVKDATCELARELLKADRTADPDSKGVSSVNVGPISVTFNADDRPALIPEMVKLMLRPFGRLLTSRSRYVDVRRV
jgi:hypothetical protein